MSLPLRLALAAAFAATPSAAAAPVPPPLPAPQDARAAGGAAFARKDFDTAAREYAAAVAALPRDGDPQARALLLHRLGQSLMGAGRPREAEPPLREAVALEEASGSTATRAVAYCALGNALAAAERYREGAAALAEGARLHVASGNTREATLALLLQAAALTQNADIRRAQPVLEEACALARTLGEPLVEAYGERLRGTFYLGLDLRRAREALAAAAVAYGRLGTPGGPPDLRIDQARLEFDDGRDAEAEVHARSALAALPRGSAPALRYRALYLLVRIMERVGRWEEAAALAEEEARAAAAPGTARMRAGLWSAAASARRRSGNVVLARAHLAAAEESLREWEAAEAPLPGSRASAWSGIAGEHMQQGAPAACLAILDGLLDRGDGPDRIEPGMLKSILAFRGIALHALGRYAEAMDAARATRDAVDRQSSGLADEHVIAMRAALECMFGLAVEAAHRSGSPDAALEFLESGRGRGLLEAIRARGESRALLLGDKAAEEEDEAVAEEARAVAAAGATSTDPAAARAAKARLEAARDRRRALHQRLQREARLGPGLAVPVRPVEGAVLRSLLRPGEVVVLYSMVAAGPGMADAPVAESLRDFAVVVRRDGIRTVALDPALRHGDAFRDLHRALAGAGPADAALATLRASFVEPLGLTPADATVLLSPDGPLAGVPPVLLFPGRDAACIPSGTVLAWLRERVVARGEGVLALGDPDYGPAPVAAGPTASLRSGAAGLPPLPGSRAEAKAVGTRVLLGKEATEAGLRAALASRPRWRAVHFACHGLLDPADPLDAALALSPGGGDDGLVTALDLFSLPVPADLVVLSACDTGRGRLVQGEGVLGLTRAFFSAGASRVVGSHWKVDDAATAFLMERFHASLAAGRPSAAALREAQEAVRARPGWEHPRYWAAWALWGLPD